MVTLLIQLALGIDQSCFQSFISVKNFSSINDFEKIEIIL
jgi:hypothetical protein